MTEAGARLRVSGDAQPECDADPDQDERGEHPQQEGRLRDRKPGEVAWLEEELCAAHRGLDGFSDIAAVSRRNVDRLGIPNVRLLTVGVFAAVRGRHCLDCTPPGGNAVVGESEGSVQL